MADTPELHRVTPGNKRAFAVTDLRSPREMDLLDDRWPGYLRVSWFSLFLVFGSMIEILLAVLQIEIRIEILARALFVCSAGVVMMRARDRSHLAPANVQGAALLLCGFALISLVKDLLMSASASAAMDSFVFIYGIGILLVFSAIVPLSARFGSLFLLLAITCVIFGLLQLATQSLYLPAEYLREIGLVYEKFVNDRLRVVSFFRSPPGSLNF